MPAPLGPPCERCGKRAARTPPLCGRCREQARRRAAADERRRLPIPRLHRDRTPDEQADAEAAVERWKAMTDEERAEAVRQALR
jgi:hypothetical protein